MSTTLRAGMAPSPSKPTIKCSGNSMWRHMGTLMARRTTSLRRQHTLRRRRMKLLGVGRGRGKLFGQPKTYLRNMWTVPSLTHTFPRGTKSQPWEWWPWSGTTAQVAESVAALPDMSLHLTSRDSPEACKVSFFHGCGGVPCLCHPRCDRKCTRKMQKFFS